jgi:AraC-like DNA-binding protein
MALKEVAAHLGMNANYLSGLFHRATGTTFHRYLHAVRMSKAEELLRDPRARVCEVATAVGYLSPNHFRSVFKACEKLSPSAWTLALESAKAEKSGAFLRGPP